jgi:hypothetical protein
MLLALLLIALSPIWVPLALALAIALLLFACAIIVIVSLALLAVLIVIIRTIFQVKNWIELVRKEVIKDAHDELKNVSYYRLMRLYWRQMWKTLKQPREF